MIQKIYMSYGNNVCIVFLEMGGPQLTIGYNAKNMSKFGWYGGYHHFRKKNNHMYVINIWYHWLDTASKQFVLHCIYFTLCIVCFALLCFSYHIVILNVTLHTRWFDMILVQGMFWNFLKVMWGINIFLDWIVNVSWWWKPP